MKKLCEYYRIIPAVILLFIGSGFQSNSIGAADYSTQLQQSVESYLETIPQKTARWGICVLSSKSAERQYSLNSDEFFIVASNIKLFTVALALDQLGPQHQRPRVRRLLPFQGRPLLLLRHPPRNQSLPAMFIPCMS